MEGQEYSLAIETPVWDKSWELLSSREPAQKEHRIHQGYTALIRAGKAAKATGDVFRVRNADDIFTSNWSQSSHFIFSGEIKGVPPGTSSGPSEEFNWNRRATQWWHSRVKGLSHLRHLIS